MMIMALAPFLLVACFWWSALGQTCNPPTCFMNGTREIQCQICPIGFGVVVENREPLICSSSPPRNTKCEPCVAGVNYSDTHDQESKCSGCLKCHSEKEVEAEPCTTESNTVCICKTGQYYYHDGLETCFECIDCTEDEEETSPCTPTENRECGPRRSRPVTSSTPVSRITSSVPIANGTTSVIDPNTIDPGMSVKPQPGWNSVPGGLVAVIVIVIVVIIGVIIIIVVCMRRDQEGACSLNCKWHIRKTENQAPAVSTVYSTHETNEMNGMNGHVPRCAIPDTSVNMLDDPNGVAYQCNGPRSSEEQVEHQQPVEVALELSSSQLRRVIRELDHNDAAGRDVRMLAGQYLSDDTSNLLPNEVSATEVLKLWVNQRKTKANLVEALRDMGRDDIATICEEG